MKGHKKDYEAVEKIESAIVSLHLATNKRSPKSMIVVLKSVRHEVNSIIEGLKNR